MIAVSQFPRSFDGNPYTYAFALFSLTLVSALSMAQFMAYLFEDRRHREISRLIHNALLPPLPERLPMSAAKAFRRIVVSFLAVVFMGAFPDVLILLAWGEGTVPTMEALFFIDRLCDGLLIAPFLAAMWLLARTRQSLPQQLIKAVDVPLGPFSIAMLKDNAKIVAVVLVIAVGVTIGKAHA